MQKKMSVNDSQELNSSINVINSSVTNGQRMIWIAIAVQAAIAVYVCVALVYYECCLASKKREAKVKGLRWVLILTAMFAVAFFAVTITSFADPSKRIYEWENKCHFLVVLQKFTYFITIHFVYIFLWLRQKLFYSTPTMNHFYNRTFKCISWSVCIVIVICFILQTLFSVLGTMITDSKDTTHCMPKEWLKRAQVYLEASSSIVVQLSLLMLFVYPLLRHQLDTTNLLIRERKSLTKNNNEITEISKTDSLSRTLQRSLSHTRTRLNSNQRLEKALGHLQNLIRRCTWLTFCCVCVNVIATIIALTTFKTQTRPASLIYSCNLLINITCSVGFFGQWRSMLLPFCRKGDNNNNNPSSYSIFTQNKSTASSPARSRSIHLQSFKVKSYTGK